MEGSEFALTSALLAALGAVVYFSWSGTPAQAQQASTKVSASTKPKSSAAGKRGKKRRPNETSSLIPVPPTDDHDDTSPSDTKSKSNPNPSSSPLVLKRTSPPPPAAPRVVIQRTSEAIVPGGLAPLLSASEMESVHSAGSSAAKSTQKKKRKAAKKEQNAVVRESEPERMHPGGLMLAPPSAASSKKTPVPVRLHETSGASEFDSESGWTRVKRSSRGGSAHGGTMESTSDAGVTTSVTEEEGSVASASGVSAKRDGGKTLTSAEKLLPKAVETKVDDMLEGPKPSIARVLRVTGSSSSGVAVQPAQGLTWEDYEDGNDVKGSGGEADEEDSTWDVVSHKRRGGTQTPSTYASDSARMSTSGAGGSVSGSAPSKKQRNNAARREAEKDARAVAEKARLERLAKHNRELERSRIEEQFKGKSGKRAVGGGMQAQVDASGKLIFD